MLTIHVPFSVVAILLPDGIRLISVMGMPSVTSIAVPLLSVPTFMYAVYRRIALRSGVVTSCTSARSMSCFHRNSSSILIRVFDDIPFMFNVATLYIWIMMGDAIGVRL